MKRVLITGGYGNLGSWLVNHFAAAGHEVAVLARKHKGFLSVPHTFIAGDVTDAAGLKAALAGTQFDAVIHAASHNDFFVDNYAHTALQVNALGTRNLLEALQDTPAGQLLYFSTFHVYGAAGGQIDESFPTVPRNDYASTHLFAEHYVRQFHANTGLPYDIIRLTNSYGCPLDPASSKWYLVLNDLAKMAVEKGKIVLNSNGKPQRDFIWMGDVCSVMQQLVERDAASNATYNLSSGQTFQVLEIAAAVQAAYTARFGDELPIETNPNDTNTYDNPLQVSNALLQSVVPFTPNNRFQEEAARIFGLLEG